MLLRGIIKGHTHRCHLGYAELERQTIESTIMIVWNKSTHEAYQIHATYLLAERPRPQALFFGYLYHRPLTFRNTNLTNDKAVGISKHYGIHLTQRSITQWETLAFKLPYRSPLQCNVYLYCSSVRNHLALITQANDGKLQRCHFRLHG